MATTARALGSKLVDPLSRCMGLVRRRIRTHRRPIAVFAVNLLVRYRAFHHQNEGVELTLRRLVERLHEIIAHFVGENRIMQMHFGKARNCTQQNILNAGGCVAAELNGIAITAGSRR